MEHWDENAKDMEQAPGTARAVRLDRRQFLKMLAGLAGTAAAGAVLNSCAPAAPTAPPTAASVATSAPTSAATVVPSKVPTSAPTVAATATPVKTGADQVLKVAVSDFYGEYLDPLEGSASSHHLLRHMIGYFVDVVQGTGALAPGIVKSWEIAPDGLSWTFHLRNDVLFHDGSKCTAKDLVFTLQQAMSERSGDASVWRQMLGDTLRADILDEYSVRVYTKGPQPLLLASSVNEGYGLMPKGYFEKNGVANFKAHPIGTGPYKFVRHVPGDSLEFQAVDYKHWQKNPDFGRLIMYLVPEEATRIAMLETGKLDQIELGLEAALTLEKKGYTVVEGNLSEPVLYLMGVNHPLAKGTPLSDVRVRQALSYAINRKEIIDTMFAGRGVYETLTPPMNFWEGEAMLAMGPERVSYWKKWATENWRYDLAKAKQLIADAGYSKGFSIEYWASPDAKSSWITQLAPVLAGYWQKIGGDIKIVNVDTATWKSNRDSKKSTKLVGKMGANPLVIGDYALGAIPAIDRWTSKYGSWDLLVGSPDQEQYDKLWLEGMSSLDMKRTGQIMDGLLQIQLNSWTAFPVVAAPSYNAFGPRVKSPPTIIPPYDNPADFYAYWEYSGMEKKT